MGVATVTCTHTPRHPTWITKDEREVLVCEMETSHLTNAYRYAGRAIEWWTAEADAAFRMEGILNGEEASYQAGIDGGRALDNADVWSVWQGIFEKEIERRTNDLAIPELR